MAQLSDDCFAFGGPMTSVGEAVSLVTARLSAVEETERVGLIDADGRVLASDLKAPLALPPFTNSAVDGYAVRGEDLPVSTEQAFPVTSRIQAGAQTVPVSIPGQVSRIFTGAPMPEGADTVFMQEDVSIDANGNVVLPIGLKRGANVRPAGEDVAKGSVILPRGRLMRPQDVALAAAFGMTGIEVRRRVRVAVFSTGDEIVAPGNARAPAQLFDSNRFMLIAMLRRLGCEVSDLGILDDNRSRIASALNSAATTHDLILTSGGVSTGEADHVKASLESIGTLHFWRIAIKPGRPVAMGVIAGTPFIGLPGNPVATFVTFVHVVRPALLTLAGAEPQQPIATAVRSAFSYRKKIGRREYVRASLRQAADGTLEVTKFPREGAGLMSSLVKTDGLVELREDINTVEPGQIVKFIPYSGFI